MRLTALVLALTSLAAFAQEDGGVVAAATVAPAPSVLDTFLEYVHPYATLKPTVILSGAGTESYSQPNESAVTAAGNPVITTLPTNSRLTFQIAQSRLSILHNMGATLGYELRLNKYLAFLFEGFVLQTEHQLLDFDAGRTARVRNAFGGELAALVSF